MLGVEYIKTTGTDSERGITGAEPGKSFKFLIWQATSWCTASSGHWADAFYNICCVSVHGCSGSSLSSEVTQLISCHSILGYVHWQTRLSPGWLAYIGLTTVKKIERCSSCWVRLGVRLGKDTGLNSIPQLEHVIQEWVPKTQWQCACQCCVEVVSEVWFHCLSILKAGQPD